MENAKIEVDISEVTKKLEENNVVTKYRKLKGPVSVITLISIVILVLLSLNWIFDWRLFSGYVMQPYTFYYLIVAFLAPLVFIYIPATRKQRISDKKYLYYLDLFLALAVFISNVYLASNAYNIYMFGWERIAPTLATIVSVFLWACYIEMARRCAGGILTIVIVIIATLPLYTQYLPGVLNGLHKSFLLTAQMHILGTNSSMGVLMTTFAELVFPYTLFGTVIIACGGGEFFLSLAIRLFGRFRGGTAKVATFASALFGTISGNPVVNVLTTGSVTIPAMKKCGFEPEVAGAVEACASTAGTMTPPIMGTASFVMASILGISYAEVALSAAVPIAFFYISFLLAIDMYSAKKKLSGIPKSEMPSMKVAFKSGWFFIPTIAVLAYFIFVARQIPQAAIYSSLTAILITQSSKATRFTKEKLIKMIVDTGTNSLEVLGVMLGIGFILGSFSMTGVGISFPRAIFQLAGGNMVVLVVLTAIVSLIMGMGMTTISCYIFLSIVVAPALVLGGFNIVCVHLFLLYCGMLSYITPPVAIATIPAAMISGASGSKIGLTACKMAISLIFLPFFFVGNPDLLLRGNNVMETIQSILTMLFAVLIITQAVAGYFYGIGEIKMRIIPKAFLMTMLVGGAMLLAVKGTFTDIIGLSIIAAILVPIYLITIRNKRKVKLITTEY